MKLVNVIVPSCQDCPFCRFDSYYNRSHSDGWDCKHDDSDVGRIVDSWAVEPGSANYRGWPPIPTGCPLPDYKEPEEIIVSAIKL